MDLNKVSRFLSLILRHHPEKIGITLDERDASILIRKRGSTKASFPLLLKQQSFFKSIKIIDDKFLHIFFINFQTSLKHCIT